MAAFISCKKETSENDSLDLSQKLQQEQTIDTTDNRKPSIPQEQPKPHNKLSERPIQKYVNAASGLNFRDAPNGKILGKFPFNSSIAIIGTTGVYDTIQDAGKKITGEWVKVKTYSTSVYVFDAFLSESYTEQEMLKSELRIFSMMTYNPDKNYPFVSLGDAFMGNYDDSNVKTLELNFTNQKDWTTLSKKDRKEYLKFLQLHENEQVHVYDYHRNKYFKFAIKELPLIAVSAYYDTDYYIGFDFKNKIQCDVACHQSFVAIGKENPFSEEGVTPILWEAIDIKKIEKPVLVYFHHYMKDYDINEAYIFRLDGHEYQYLQISFETQELPQRYVIIKDKNGRLIRQHHLTSSEGHGPTGFIRKGDADMPYSQQYAGNLFQGKPQVYFSFIDEYYDCNTIEFVDTTIPPIRISCDNRH